MQNEDTCNRWDTNNFYFSKFWLQFSEFSFSLIVSEARKSHDTIQMLISQQVKFISTHISNKKQLISLVPRVCTVCMCGLRFDRLSAQQIFCCRWELIKASVRRLIQLASRLNCTRRSVGRIAGAGRRRIVLFQFIIWRLRVPARRQMLKHSWERMEMVSSLQAYVWNSCRP